VKNRVFEISATLTMWDKETLTEGQLVSMLEETGDVLRVERITIRELEAP